MSWQKNVAEALERHEMLRYGRCVGVAVSGGADSVFLLRVLSELELAVAVLHVNHGLRGAESDEDERFVRALASQFGLPAYVAARPPGEGNVEQEARRARYQFFAECIAAGYCGSVATGHTLDDQAETVLSRFLRGTGSAGLSGVRPVTETRIVRPLLGLRRDDIRRWLSDAGIEWHEDCSNSDTDFQRNRIRLQLMPQLAQLNPSLPHVLESTAAWAQAEEDYWTTELDRFEPVHLLAGGEAILTRTGSFLELPLAVQRRLLRRGIERVRGSLRGIDFQHVEAVRRVMRAREGSGRLQLPGLDAYRSFDWLRLAPPGLDSRLERDFEVRLEIPGRTLLPERRIAIISALESDVGTAMEPVTESGVYNEQMNALEWGRLDRAQCTGLITLRNWRPGDSYRPVGHKSAAKIKTLFQEYRVPLWERRTWPVIVHEGSILWARRFGPSGDFAAGPHTERVLSIREAGESKSSLDASIQSGEPGNSAADFRELKRAADSPHDARGRLSAEVM